MLLDDIAKIFNQSRGKDRDDLGKADYLSWALHCHRLAFTVLALFVFFTTVHQLSQTPIECNFHSSYPGLSTKYLNARCLVDTMSTSVRLEAEEPGPEITPGIFVAVERRTVTVSHWYYIYVPMLLFAQAALVYAPVFLWRRIHRQRLVPYLIKAKGGKDDSPTGLVGRAKINLDKLAQLLADHRGQQRAYTFWFAACHLLGIAFVVAQFHVASLFFGSMLNEYGLSMLSMKDFVVEGANVTISDAVNHVFPTSTTCHITLFGDGGKGSSLSPLCVLPLNIFNGWLYVVVWVIYVFLIVANILLLLGYSALKLIPALRTALIWFTLPKGVRYRHVIDNLNDMCYFDWFFLMSILYQFPMGQDRERLVTHLIGATNNRRSVEQRRFGGDSGIADLSSFTAAHDHSYRLEKEMLV